MVLLRDVLLPIIELVKLLINVEVILILVRIVLSYTTVSRYHPLVVLVYQFTDPPINLARRLPHIVGQFDFSPMIACVGLYLVGSILGNLAADLLNPLGYSATPSLR